ncbi:MAG: GNAT family N-acetyltransferase, partial [Desulfobulbaceae bacterium]|nr:GNAT family N-acetyltransferase [Desulfobulbaceae bacterium]HIJ80042.1 GNAT family N-acetyltransferase [Deltaproteobacteria bacterium]
MILRPLSPDNITEYADMLYVSFNFWYWKHGWGRDYFTCNPHETAIFYQIYNDLTPGCNIAAFETKSGRMMGACFYHPREHHVSLGIMSVHPNYLGKGVGRSLVDHITDYADRNGYKACRIASSAINMDSFSLYNRSGFVPRVTHQDMVINIPATGMGSAPITGQGKVRQATLNDIGGMGEMEMEVSNIRREIDYRYAIDNPRQVMHASVYVNDQQTIDGFMISVKHPALNMLG